MYLHITSFFTVWIQILILITETGALPRWNSREPKYHDLDTSDGCVIGRCVRSSECSIHATLFKPTGECALRKNGPWVCAVEVESKPKIQTDINANSLKVTSESTKLTSPRHWKTTSQWTRNTTPKSLVKTTTSSSFVATTKKSVPNNERNWRTYPTKHDIWNRNTKGDLTTSSLWEKSHEEFWHRSSTPKPESKWTRYPGDMPSSSEITFPTTKKTWSRQSNQQNKQTTHSWHKPTTRIMGDNSDSEVVHKPFTVNERTTKRSSVAGIHSWHKPTTRKIEDKSDSEVVHKPYAVNSERRTTKRSSVTDTHSWHKPTTRKMGDKTDLEVVHKPYTVNSERRTTKRSSVTDTHSWHKPTTRKVGDKSDSEVVHKPYTINSEKRTTKHSSVTNPWRESTKIWDDHTNRKSSSSARTKQESQFTTAYPRRVTRSTTQYYGITKSSASTDSNNFAVREALIAAEKKKTVGWHKGSSTTTGKWTTSRKSSTERSSPKRASSTTPLPSVNTQLCGLRNVNQNGNRRIRKNLLNNNKDSIIVNRVSTGNRQPFQRIVGGKEAEPFSWPWVAALYKVTPQGGNRFLSAGSLINEHFVLTASHVFTPDDLRSSSYVVMLGTHTAKEAVAEYMVTSVIRHPEYQQRFYYNDIALLRLDRPVSFNDYVMPICLPSPSAPLLRDENLVGKKVTVMGWGDDAYGGVTSRVLKEATFPIVSRRSCNDSYVRVASNRFPKGITENMLCAGSPNGGKDACQGDSGGPLISVENGRHTQVGIVSFGYKCGDKDFPGVYTKVAPYLSWIAENTVQDKFYHGYGDYHRR